MLGAVTRRARLCPAVPPDARRAARRAALALTAGLLAGCAAPPGGGADVPPAAPATPSAPLPADWDARSPEAFERWYTSLAPGAGVALEEADLRELRAALDAGETVDEVLRGVRAALVLGASRDPRAPGLLLERLELRVRPEARHADAADVVAAAALVDVPEVDAPERPDVTERLAELAIGDRPHPDLEVRVECAATALARGRDDVAPFLLAVMRDLTLAGRADDKDWPYQETMAWAKSRAARALFARLGRTSTFSPDVGYAEQERRVAALAGELRAAGVAVPASF